MSLKDNFNQAIKEILKKEGVLGNDPPAEQPKTELDKYLESQNLANFDKNSPRDSLKISDTGEIKPFEQPTPAEDDFTEGTPQISADEQLKNSRDAYDSFTEDYRKSSQAARDAGYGQTAGFSSSNSDFSSGGYQGYSSDSYSQTQSIPPSYGAFKEEFRRSDFSSANPFNGQGAGSVAPPPPPSGGSGRFSSVPPSSGSGSGFDSTRYEAEETTIISHNTIIDGNIRSFANVNVDGTVKGDVRLTKNIALSGKVVGDIECNNAVMTGSQMQGNVSSKGQVQMDRDSMQLGDITANYLDLNGKIKGNIEVGGKAEFKTDAVILGNITASTITVLDGATIQGYVNTTFLQESSSNIFPESITISD